MGSVCAKNAKTNVTDTPVATPVAVTANASSSGDRPMLRRLPVRKKFLGDVLEKKRHSTTRVRRLSVVDSKENASAVEEDIPRNARNEAALNDYTNAEQEAQSTLQTPETPKIHNTKKKSTRSRRLSVVSTEEMEKQAHVHFSTPMEEDTRPNLKAEPIQVRHMARSSSSKARVLFGSDIGCLSQTGREPGSKKTNQDNCFAFEKFIRHGHALYAAFDGHGPNGHIVSSFVKHQLPLLLTRRLSRRATHSGNEDDIRSVLCEVFSEVHESVCLPPIDAEFSGTTATVGLVLGAKLYVAWVGDSRCVIGIDEGKGNFVARDVTRDHKPDGEKERARIIANGGRVKRLKDQNGNEIGPSRVWLKYAWIPGLAMSRALGDICAHQVGVSCDPDVNVQNMTPDVACLVMASDGVWEFVSSQEAIDIVQSCDDSASACRKLIDEAYHRWLQEENGVVDDITAVVVKFEHYTGDEENFAADLES